MTDELLLQVLWISSSNVGGLPELLRMKSIPKISGSFECKQVLTNRDQPGRVEWLTDRPDMTLAVYRGLKTTTTTIIRENTCSLFQSATVQKLRSNLRIKHDLLRMMIRIS